MKKGDKNYICLKDSCKNEVFADSEGNITIIAGEPVFNDGTKMEITKKEVMTIKYNKCCVPSISSVIYSIITGFLLSWLSVDLLSYDNDYVNIIGVTLVVSIFFNCLLNMRKYIVIESEDCFIAIPFGKSHISLNV